MAGGRQVSGTYLRGQLSSSQHEAQCASGQHSNNRQSQQPVLLQEIPHGPLQVLLHRHLEEGLDSVPHRPPCVSRSI